VESLKVTLPVGVLDSPNEAIVAENVTGFPCADGFRLLAIAVDWQSVKDSYGQMT
jgi:hypothetical protein